MSSLPPYRDTSLSLLNARRVVEPGRFQILVGGSSRTRDLLQASCSL